MSDNTSQNQLGSQTIMTDVSDICNTRYNFCRIHQTLRVTPAMVAGVTQRLWSIEDIVELLETKEKNDC